MAREINRLTARGVAGLREPGLHADGAGLYLRIDQAGARRWTFVFHLAGRRRELGLGSAADVDLKAARAGAASAREVIRQGGDPIADRRAGAAPCTPTFGAVADELIQSLRPGWRSGKHAEQWAATLQAHAAALRAMPVDAVATEHVLAALQPLWAEKPETASRVRGRIERVLDAAKARGLRDGDNPARWRGHLSLLLPPRRKLARGHFDALPYPDAPALMRRLATHPGLGAQALRFTILTAGRTSMTLGATWAEIDRDLWVTPAARMKGGREHRTPLTGAALDVLEAVRPLRRADDLIFPGRRPGAALSNMTMDKVLRALGMEVTVHGFRSTFKDWASDCTAFPDTLSEEALAHAVGSEVRRAYRRGDALEKRRALMEAWAGFLTQPEAANVIPLRR